MRLILGVTKLPEKDVARKREVKKGRSDKGRLTVSNGSLLLRAWPVVPALCQGLVEAETNCNRLRRKR